MTEIAQAWLDAFKAGVGCSHCGSPMMAVPTDEEGQHGTYLCVPCTWAEDKYRVGLQDGRDEAVQQLSRALKAICDEMSNLADLSEKTGKPINAHGSAFRSMADDIKLAIEKS